jgi:hypothetical protein
MRLKPTTQVGSVELVVKDIRLATKETVLNCRKNQDHVRQISRRTQYCGVATTRGGCRLWIEGRTGFWRQVNAGAGPDSLLVNNKVLTVELPSKKVYISNN